MHTTKVSSRVPNGVFLGTFWEMQFCEYFLADSAGNAKLMHVNGCRFVDTGILMRYPTKREGSGYEVTSAAAFPPGKRGLQTGTYAQAHNDNDDGNKEETLYTLLLSRSLDIVSSAPYPVFGGSDSVLRVMNVNKSWRLALKASVEGNR